VAGIIEQSKDKSDLRYTLPIEFIKSWQKTIDSDLSLKKMDAVFPLPADLAGQAPRIPLAQK